MTRPYVAGDAPIDIGSRLEMMVDEHLIARMGGGVELRLNRPTIREAVLITDEPWEGNACGYFTVFQDGDIYRMYYRGWHFVVTEEANEIPHAEVVCYAESSDGIHWIKPELGLVEFNGSKKNNIILAARDDGPPVSSFAPFKDANPAAEPDAQYKAWAVGQKPRGLYPWKSADGIRWTLMQEQPVITDGYFDSQNLAFWDTTRNEYRDYHRSVFYPREKEAYQAHRENVGAGASLRGSRFGRDIYTATSGDFIHWTEPTIINYTQGRTDELYTNAIIPYFRAPHIFMGFPMRYIDRGWSEAMNDLPELEHRQRRANVNERYGSALTDGMFMTSRDGQTFNLWPESFIRPGLRPKENWTYADNCQNWGIVTTKSSVDGAPDELSIYTQEDYWRGESMILRRHTLRQDGFVSAGAPLRGGELVTNPLIFAGRELALNFSASAAGSIRVEVLGDQEDTPIPGFRLEECVEVLGDDLQRRVRWTDGSDLSRLTGVPIRLRFMLSDADLFAFRFTE